MYLVLLVSFSAGISSVNFSAVIPFIVYSAIVHYVIFSAVSLAFTASTVTLLLLSCRWITTEDKLALEDPSLFCDTCYTMLHLDKAGGKLYEYKAFPFVDVVTPDMLQRNQSEQSDTEVEAAVVT